MGAGLLSSCLERSIEREGLRNVEFLGPRSLDDVHDLVLESDVQMVTLAPRDLFKMTIPSKLQFSLAFGKPIIAAVAGDAAQIAAESGAALVCEPGNPDALADAIRLAAGLDERQLHKMGRRGEEFFRKRFSEEVGGAAMASLLEDVARGAEARGRSNV